MLIYYLIHPTPHWENDYGLKMGKFRQLDGVRAHSGILNEVKSKVGYGMPGMLWKALSATHHTPNQTN